MYTFVVDGSPDVAINASVKAARANIMKNNPISPWIVFKVTKNIPERRKIPSICLSTSIISNLTAICLHFHLEIEL